MPNQQNFSMPGPNFEDDKSSGWIKNNSHKIIPVLIIALIIAGGLYFYRSYQARTALLKPALNEIASQSSPAATDTSQIKTDDKIKSIANPAPKAEKISGKIIITAAKGNGATHLARQALKEYLKDKPEIANQLKAEQKIYIEDYLRKHVDQLPPILKVGDEISFSENLIKIAIEESQKLTDQQLKNLQKYVSLVPSLMTP